jgi:hypothetical protein
MSGILTHLSSCCTELEEYIGFCISGWTFDCDIFLSLLFFVLQHFNTFKICVCVYVIWSYSFKISDSYCKIEWPITSLPSNRWIYAVVITELSAVCVHTHLQTFFLTPSFVSYHEKRGFAIVLFVPFRRQLKMMKGAKIQQIGVVTQRVTPTVVMMRLSMPVSENVSWRGSVCVIVWLVVFCTHI